MNEPSDEEKEIIAHRFLQGGEDALGDRGYYPEVEKLRTITAIVATGLIAAFIQNGNISNKNVSLVFLFTMSGLGMFWLASFLAHKNRGRLASIFELAKGWEKMLLGDFEKIERYFWREHKKRYFGIFSYSLSVGLFLASLIILFVAGFVG